MRGRFITFEGGDGAGKTTQIELLAVALTRAGQTPLVTREPGGTKLAEEIRNWVLHHASSMDATTEVLLMFAARSHHTKEVIEPTQPQAVGSFATGTRTPVMPIRAGGGACRIP